MRGTPQVTAPARWWLPALLITAGLESFYLVVRLCLGVTPPEILSADPSSAAVHFGLFLPWAAAVLFTIRSARTGRWGAATLTTAVTVLVLGRMLTLSGETNGLGRAPLVAVLLGAALGALWGEGSERDDSVRTGTFAREGALAGLAASWALSIPAAVLDPAMNLPTAASVRAAVWTEGALGGGLGGLFGALISASPAAAWFCAAALTLVPLGLLLCMALPRLRNLWFSAMLTLLLLSGLVGRMPEITEFILVFLVVPEWRRRDGRTWTPDPSGAPAAGRRNRVAVLLAAGAAAVAALLPMPFVAQQRAASDAASPERAAELHAAWLERRCEEAGIAAALSPEPTWQSAHGRVVVRTACDATGFTMELEAPGQAFGVLVRVLGVDLPDDASCLPFPGCALYACVQPDRDDNLEAVRAWMAAERTTAAALQLAALLGHSDPAGPAPTAKIRCEEPR